MSVVSFKKVQFYLLGLCLLCFTINAHAGNPPVKSIKILTIGNSFADNACTYLEQIAQSVPGCTIKITKANIGGCPLEKHFRFAQKSRLDTTWKPYYNKYSLKDLLLMDKYDYITIQQASHLSFIQDSLQPYADSLVAFIRQYAPQSNILIHQTWAYSPSCPRLTGWNITRDSMQRGLLKSYSLLQSTYHFHVLPSGNAMYSSYKKKPGLYLWKDDGFHANNTGCYLVGCVWFGIMFGESPKKVGFVPDEIKPRDAKFLRKVAAGEIKKLKQ